jgi:antitoxin VapB
MRAEALPMALNIKSERTCELAVELAEVTGESKTQAITVAPEERLERERRPRRKKATVEEIMEMARQVVEGLDPKPVDDHGDFFYGEDGLPG